MNGSLDITIARNPLEMQFPDEGDHSTGYGIEPDEWDELFITELKKPPYELSDRKEGAHIRFEDQRLNFLAYFTAQGFPLLGRIWHIYQDAVFMPEEVEPLLGECKHVLDRIRKDNALAQSAVNKLICACDVALENESGIILLSD